MDGRQFAFTEGVGDGIELFAADSKGLRRQQLTSLGGFNFFPAWAPDGQHIAFEHFDDAQHHGGVWIMDTDGSNPHAVVPDMGGFYTGRPAWRPIRGQAHLRSR
jgi:Tol biopolymer transport system component